VIIIESDTSYDHNPFEVTYAESSDHCPFQATSDESSDHNPFQDTSDESSDHNHFQATLDDTLKSSSEDTYSSDSTWEQKKSLDEHMTVYKGRPRSSSRNAAITKPKKSKSRSKHLAPTTPRTGSTSTTLLVLIKRPPPVMNCALGLAAVKTWQQILNRKFEIKKAKGDVGGSSDVRRKGPYIPILSHTPVVIPGHRVFLQQFLEQTKQSRQSRKMWEAIEGYQQVILKQAQRDIRHAENLALLQKYFKKIYNYEKTKPQSSSNNRNKECGLLLLEKQNGVKDFHVSIRKDVVVVNNYMEKIQEVPNADSGSALSHVRIETGDSNVIPDSPDMCDNDIQDDTK
ncbi:hypothetical protein Tco_1394427, partial [Tanacetum coccineum]